MDLSPGLLAEVPQLKSHPRQVREQLRSKVDELLADGQDPAVITAALKIWVGRPKAGAGLLPFLVSEAMREGGGLRAALRDAWKTGNVTPLRRWGHWWEEPDDVPPDVKTPSQMRAFLLARKRIWIEQVEKELA